MTYMVKGLVITASNGINKNRGNKNYKGARIVSTPRVLIVPEILESLVAGKKTAIPDLSF